MGRIVHLEAGDLYPDVVLKEFLGRIDGKGAVVNFTGLMRPVSKQGKPLTGLFLDHYPGMTERTLEAIADDTSRQFDVDDLVIIHRCGMVAPNAPIVFVAVASAHRRAAFLAADYMMDRLKTDAGFWKREDSADGSRWIEPTQQDQADRKRWSKTDGGN